MCPTTTTARTWLFWRPDATHSAGDENSSAVKLAARILAQRDAGPRLNQNLLVFVAAAANRLAELRVAARSFLAWQSIVDDHDSLDLTAQQKRQADSKLADASKQVDSLIAETFTQVLVPSPRTGYGRHRLADNEGIHRR